MVYAGVTCERGLVDREAKLADRASSLWARNHPEIPSRFQEGMTRCTIAPQCRSGVQNARAVTRTAKILKERRTAHPDPPPNAVSTSFYNHHLNLHTMEDISGHRTSGTPATPPTLGHL